MFYTEHSGPVGFVMVEQKEPGIHESGEQTSPWLQYTKTLAPRQFMQIYPVRLDEVCEALSLRSRDKAEPAKIVQVCNFAFDSHVG